MRAMPPRLKTRITFLGASSQRRLLSTSASHHISLYEQCTHPDAKTREEIAARLGLHPKQVEIWFQNRRSQKTKKAQVKENKQIQQANASLQSENQSLRQAMMTQSCITCGPAPPLMIGSRANREALYRHTDTSMEQFLVLATKGEPVWIPTTDGDILDYKYGATISSFLFGLRRKGFGMEASRDNAMVWGTATDLVGILMDTARWSEMLLGIVASV